MHIHHQSSDWRACTSPAVQNIDLRTGEIPPLAVLLLTASALCDHSVDEGVLEDEILVTFAEDIELGQQGVLSGVEGAVGGGVGVWSFTCDLPCLNRDDQLSGGDDPKVAVRLWHIRKGSARILARDLRRHQAAAALYACLPVPSATLFGRRKISLEPTGERRSLFCMALQ